MSESIADGSKSKDNARKKDNKRRLDQGALT